MIAAARVGCVGLHRTAATIKTYPAFARDQVIIAAGRKHWGKGARGSRHAALAYAFDTLKLRRIILWSTGPTNDHTRWCGAAARRISAPREPLLRDDRHHGRLVSGHAVRFIVGRIRVQQLAHADGGAGRTIEPMISA